MIPINWQVAEEIYLLVAHFAEEDNKTLSQVLTDLILAEDERRDMRAEAIANLLADVSTAARRPRRPIETVQVSL